MQQYKFPIAKCPGDDVRVIDFIHNEP